MLTCRCGRPSEVMETRTCAVAGRTALRRRRRCSTQPPGVDCGHRWTTYEIGSIGHGDPAAVLDPSAVAALRALLEQMRLLCDALEPIVGQPVMAPLSAAAERAADALAS